MNHSNAANPYQPSPSRTDAVPKPDPLADPRATQFERNYALAMHLTLLGFHLLVPVVPVLVLHLLKKNESPFIADHGREALNFQLSILLYAIVSALLVVVFGLGILLGTATYVLAIVGCILAAVSAHSGRYYRYPACIRFLSSPA